MLQGKRRQGSFGPYNQPWETGKLLDEYVRHYPKLSLNPEIISAHTERELQELQELRGAIQELEAQNKLVPEMMKIIAQQGKQLADVTAFIAKMEADKEREGTG